MKIQPIFAAKKHSAALEIDRDLFQSFLGFAPNEGDYAVAEFCIQSLNAGVLASLIQDLANDYKNISYVYDQYKLNKSDQDPKKLILETLDFFMSLSEVIEEDKRRARTIVHPANLTLDDARIMLRVSYFE